MNARALSCALVVMLIGCDSRVVVPPASEGSTGTAMDGSSTSGDATPAATTQPEPDPTIDPFEPGGSTSTTTGAVDPVDGDTGCAFLCPDDDPPSSIECSIWTQDCSPGEKCMPWAGDGGSAWNATRCTPLDPAPAAAGEPCTVEGNAVSGIDSCELGMMCWDVDPETEMGGCVPMCVGSINAPFCADPTRDCVIGAEGVLALCLAMCDPLDPQACAKGEACYRVDNGFTCAPDASGDGGGPFEPCEFTNGCDAGSTCVSTAEAEACGGMSGPACCTPYCDLTEPSCPAGSTCQAAFEDGHTPAGFETVGLCGGLE